jgi:hypothetical protein
VDVVELDGWVVVFMVFFLVLVLAPADRTLYDDLTGGYSYLVRMSIMNGELVDVADH